MAAAVNRSVSVFCRLSVSLAALSGWRGALVTVVLGGLATTALPPLHFLPGLFAFAALAWRLAGNCRPLAAATAGWLFALGYHIAGLYWISNALLVGDDKFVWLVPLAAVGLPMLLALFPAITFAVLPRISTTASERALAVVLLWCLAEYARGHLLTGMPWNLPAYALSAFDSLSQGAAWFGAYGLSLLVLLAATAPALLFGPGGISDRAMRFVGGFCLAIPLVLWVAGAVRLNELETGFDTGSVIRIVQGNIAQKDKWKRHLRSRHIAGYRRLSTQSGADRRAPGLAAGATPTVVIWPETAVPAFITGDPLLRKALAPVVPPGGSLVTGAPTWSDTVPRRLYNSMVVLTGSGSVSGRYDKSHLVPFGEYVPLGTWLPLPRIVERFADFSPGSGLRTLTIAGLGAVSPLICYEVIFPGAVVAGPPAIRPDVLLNLTNDAWYGRSSGPYQHLAISRMRAIEEGLPLIRAANTGISGIYDAFGSPVVEIALDETGVADSYLPRPLAGRTVYAVYRDLAFQIMLVLLFGILVLRRRKA